MSDSNDDKIDDPIVEAALDQGLITDQQYDAAVEIQRTVAQIGIKQTLPDILVKKGDLSADQVRVIRRGLQIRKIGKYELIEKLGSGGAGVVYRAKHSVMGRIVALKVLSDTRAHDVIYLDRFKREARVAVTLNHKNIVRGIDYGEADGYHYFVMEFVPGETLLNVIQREGRVDEKLVFEYGVQVASALAHAGEFQLVHRDLKPENLLISAHAGEVKVCDLGLAKPTALTAQLDDQTGSTIGTPSYISPEQIRGKDDTDSRSDIYSLGASLYHAVTGQPPFVADSVGELLKMHLHEPVRDPREVVVDLSSGATAVLMKMLAKDRKQRYQSLSELIADLEAVRDGRPPVHTIAFAQKSVSSGRSRSDIARSDTKTRKALFIVIGVLALAVAGVVAMMRGKDADSPGDPGDDPSANGSGGTSIRDVDTGPTEAQKSEWAFQKAEKFWREHPTAYARALESLDLVANKFADSMGAIKAKALRDEVVKRRLEAAQTSWESIEAQIDRAMRRRRYADAIGYVGQFPDELRAAAGFSNRPETRAAELQDAAHAAWAAAMQTANEAIARSEFDLAAAAVQPFGETGLEKIDRERADALESIETLRAEISVAREAEEMAFAALYGNVFVTFGTEGYDAAFDRLERGAKIEELAGAAERIGRLNDDLNRADAFAKAIREGFEAERGRMIELKTADGDSARGEVVNAGADALLLRRGSKSIALTWDEIDVAERVRRGLARRGEMTVDARVDAALWLLGRGHLRRAEEQIEVARTLGDAPADWTKHAKSVAVTLAGRVDQRLREARAALVENDGARALRILDELVVTAPDHAGIRLERGRILRRVRRTKDAIVDLEIACADPDADPLAFYEYGRALLEEDRRVDAGAAFESFLKTDPKGEEALDARQSLAGIKAYLEAVQAKEMRQKGDAAAKAEDWPAAIEAYAAASALDPNDEALILDLAEAYEHASRFLEAYVTYRHCVEVRSFGKSANAAKKAMKELEDTYADPPEVAAAFQEGVVSIRDGAYVQAVDALDKVVARAPLKARGYYNRATAYYSISLIKSDKEAAKRAIADFERYLLLDPLSSRGVTGLAKAWFQVGDREKALAEAERAISRNADDWEAHFIAGLASTQLGRHAPAVVHLDRAVELEPRRARLYLTRALAHHGLADWSAALADLDEAVKCAPDPGERSEIQTLRADIQRRLEGG